MQILKFSPIFTVACLMLIEPCAALASKTSSDFRWGDRVQLEDGRTGSVLGSTDNPFMINVRWDGSTLGTPCNVRDLLNLTEKKNGIDRSQTADKFRVGVRVVSEDGSLGTMVATTGDRYSINVRWDGQYRGVPVNVNSIRHARSKEDSCPSYLNNL